MNLNDLANEALFEASSSGCEAVVQLLLSDPKHIFTPNTLNEAIHKASENGHVIILHQLITYMDNNPLDNMGIDQNSDVFNDAIFLASKNGHDKVVEQLLSDNRVNTTTSINKKYISTLPKCISKRMSQFDFDQSTFGNYAIILTSFFGYDKVVQVLLKDHRMDPTYDSNYAIRLASYKGNYTAVKELLSDPRVDPSCRNNEAIRVASHYGHFKVVKELLADPRVDPSVRDNEAIRLATICGYYEIIKLLIADPRVNHNADFLKKLIKTATDVDWGDRGDGYEKIIELLEYL